MVGVVSSNSHPYTPTESQLISSTVIRSRFIGFFAAAKESKVRKDRLDQNIDLKVIRDNVMIGKKKIKG
jgi:hypothetical protein